jgi:hypothetical protein
MKAELLKRISRHTDVLLVEWIKSLLVEEEAEKVSIKNVQELVPKEYHFAVGNSFRLAPNSPKWIRKNLKKIVSKNPNVDISSITLEDLQCLNKK